MVSREVVVEREMSTLATFSGLPLARNNAGPLAPCKSAPQRFGENAPFGILVRLITIVITFTRS